MFTRLLWNLFTWALPAGLLGMALLIRNPLCFKVRYLLLYLICQAAVFTVPGLLRRLGAGSGRWRRLGTALKAAVILAAASLAVGQELDYQLLRARVLGTSAQTLRQVGAHLVVGYRDLDELQELVRRDAVAGVFITARNVRGRPLVQVRQELDELQRIRRARGLPPLIVAADQEGGEVSRLTPPLPPMAALSSLTEGDQGTLEQRVGAYAESKARWLSYLGVNVNLGPVVDLRRMLAASQGLDLYSRIWERAISGDPEEVSRVARVYSETLWAHGVRPTLKHFPGLGRVPQDTHLYTARLDTPLAELERSDWLPFRRVVGAVPALIMLGHVQLTALDPRYPVSSSRLVVQGVLRERWGFSGLLITDDFCMIPAWRGLGGIGPSAVRALRAGVDLLLVTADEQQVFPVLEALMKARERGELPPADEAYARLWSSNRPPSLALSSPPK